MSEVIVITSGKGGVGKTTSTANLGAGLAKLNYNVVLVDTDIGLRNLDIVMGLENRIVYDLIDYFEGRCKLRQALIKDKRLNNLFLLPAAQTRDKTAINAEQMKKLCSELKEQFDYVLIDCPAGIEQGFKNAVAGADRAIIITTPEVSAVRDADRVIGLLEEMNLPRPKLIINRIKPAMVERGEMMNVKDILDILGIDLLGVVPEDENIVITTNRGDLVILKEGSEAGKAYSNIAKRLTGEEVPFLQLKTKYSFRESLKRIIGIRNN